MLFFAIYFHEQLWYWCFLYDDIKTCFSSAETTFCTRRLIYILISLKIHSLK